MEEKQQFQEISRGWLYDLSKGINTRVFDALNMQGLRLIRATDCHLLCNFTVPSRLSDGDGNWATGSVATMIDIIATVAIFAATGTVKATVDLNISYLSTVKVQEEIEIEAKVAGRKGKLAFVVVEVRKKVDAKLIAIAQQWAASVGVTASQISKL